MPLDFLRDAPCAGKWWLFDSTDLNDHIEAKAICDACPVLDPCATLRDDLLSQPYAGNGSGPQGTWAGVLLGAGRKPGGQPKPVECGTERGYQAHKHRGETCESCREAHNKHARSRYAEKKNRESA